MSESCQYQPSESLIGKILLHTYNALAHKRTPSLFLLSLPPSSLSLPQTHTHNNSSPVMGGSVCLEGCRLAGPALLPGAGAEQAVTVAWTEV